jgi:hypothetical protein
MTGKSNRDIKPGRRLTTVASTAPIRVAKEKILTPFQQQRLSNGALQQRRRLFSV